MPPPAPVRHAADSDAHRGGRRARGGRRGRRHRGHDQRDARAPARALRRRGGLREVPRALLQQHEHRAQTGQHTDVTYDPGNLLTHDPKVITKLPPSDRQTAEPKEKVSV